jgi:hypothetical protein
MGTALAHYHTMQHREGCGFDGEFVGTCMTWDETRHEIVMDISNAWDDEYFGNDDPEVLGAVDGRYTEPHTQAGLLTEPEGLGPYHGVSVIVPAAPHRYCGLGEVFAAWKCGDDDCEHLAALEAAAE